MMMDFCIFHTVEKILLVKNLYLVNIYMYKSTTGLQTFKGCPIRLRELNTSRNKGPTSMQGGSISNGNAIRRRVARISYNNSRGEPVKASYGPLFGLKKTPLLGGNCTDKSLHSANAGNSSDVIFWKKLYGGPRTLFSTKRCSFGCNGSELFNKSNNTANDQTSNTQTTATTGTTGTA